MAINTLITLKDALIKFANDHAQIKRIEFEADDHREPKITEGDEFPMLFVAPINVQVGRAMNTHTLRIYVYERINDDRLDVLENANDTSLILRDIRVWWNDYGTDDIEIKEDLSGEFVCDRELDNVVGYFADVRFDIPSHGRCSVPINVSPSPEIVCAPATYQITDSGLDVLYSGTISSGGSLDQTIADSTATLKDTADNVLSTTQILAEGSEDIVAPDATYTVEYLNGTPITSGSIPSGGFQLIQVPNPITCADAVVNVNSVFFDNVASGGTLNIQVRKASGSDQIGALQGQHWRIPNSQITLKDTANNTLSTTNVPATESENIVAPDGTVTVNRDGVFFATQAVRSGGTATVNVPSAEWIRPLDWLPMPTVVDTDQTFVGLHAVIENGDNYVAFRFTTSTGQYQVDWGDGTVDLVNSNVNAEHQYDFATYDPTNTTLTTRGYKQAMITVTPVSGNLLTCNFQQRYVTVPAQNQIYSTGFLDCILSMPNANIGQSIIFGGVAVRHSYVERVNVLTIGNATQLGSAVSGLFQECFSLESIGLFSTINVTNIQSMFSSCVLLKKIPLFNFQNVSLALTAFQNCISLEELPLFNFQNATNLSQTFSSCRAIKEFPLFNFQNVTSAAGIFMSCNSIKTLPLFNFQNVTTLVAAFQGCTNLKELPLFNTSNVTTFLNAFSNSSLEKIPNFSTASVPLTGNNFDDYRNNNSLKRVEFIIKTSVNLSNNQLSQSALVEIFNNLVDRTLTTSANINITGNWGASALSTTDRDIALNKNWTITG